MALDLASVFNRAFPFALPYDWQARVPVKDLDDETSPRGIAGIATDVSDLLDRLPSIFAGLRSLKRLDPEAYGFLRLGAPISGDLVAWPKEQDPQFANTLPAFRAIFLGRHTSDDVKCPMVAVYMIREPMPTLLTRRTARASYRLAAFWGDGRVIAGGAAYVVVNHSGTLVPSPSPVSDAQYLPQRRRGGGGVIHHTKVSYPQWLRDVAAEHGESPEATLRKLAVLLSHAARPEGSVLVRASDADGMTAAWCIDRRDGKRFFRKRDDRRRILHYVAAHERVSANGKISEVREHYRGARNFEWLGYKVKVSGLGFHHKDVFEMSSEPVEEREDTKGAFLTADELGQRAEAIYDAPRFLSRHDR